MKTKIDAAAICLDKGCDMIIAAGDNPQILYDIINGGNVEYTLFSDK